MYWVAVVDDDITNLKIAGTILSRHDMRVTALRSGQSLLNYLETNLPDLILLDIRMPELDGFETMKLLKARPVVSDIPVIFLTGVGTREGVARVMELKPDGYILKTTTKESLISVLDSKLHFL